jgi:cyanate permease
MALAIAWIIIAVVEPSGFRTCMVSAWSVLAVLQIVAFYLARRRRRPAETETRTNDTPPR